MAASEYLLRHAIVSEDALYSAYAECCGVPFIPDKGFRPLSVNDVPIALGNATSGPLLIGVTKRFPYYVIAPTVDQFREVQKHLSAYPELAQKIRITTPQALRHAASVLQTPAGDLESRFPEFSARFRFSTSQIWGVGTVVAAFFIGMVLPLSVVFHASALVFSVLCIVIGIARWMSAHATEFEKITTHLPNEFNDPLINWPRYTVLVPLYREAASAESLISGLDALDYPKDQLDIRFLVERDDEATRDALRAYLLPHMTIVTVPPGYPRTKPRALAHGLASAAGDLVTIYDAEDLPQPDQLKKAAVIFALGPESLGCLQARLAIDNSSESFLSRQFAFEYACLFDQLIPWFNQLSWPFPLGGTSNHFKKAVLDSIGGWDKYNVTEDADLGIRLARFGYTTGVLTSTTYEEAPIAWAAWLYQRARWYKGWLHTLCVHFRQPVRTVKEIGGIRFCAIITLVGGGLLMIALHPFVALTFAGYGMGFIPLPSSSSFIKDLFLGTCVSSATIGYLGSAWAAWRAARRRGYRPSVVDLVLMPVYWICASIAFYRALWEFLITPYSWNKTSHGISRMRAAHAWLRKPPTPERPVD
ncbi:MAG: glycosyltransferase [Rhodobacteraceae bacterium]|nr:glycosyltransferase [Paracoccaceae bacterium]